jgi:hypothetical protein
VLVVLFPKRWHIDILSPERLFFGSSVTNEIMCWWFFYQRDDILIFCHQRDSVLAVLLPKRFYVGGYATREMACWWLLPEKGVWKVSASITRKLYSNGIHVFLAILRNSLSLMFMYWR